MSTRMLAVALTQRDEMSARAAQQLREGTHAHQRALWQMTNGAVSPPPPPSPGSAPPATADDLDDAVRALFCVLDTANGHVRYACFFFFVIFLLPM